jgi:uncharacterized membrane protein (Fun14 family)
MNSNSFLDFFKGLGSGDGPTGIFSGAGVIAFICAFLVKKFARVMLIIVSVLFIVGAVLWHIYHTR